MDGVKNVATVSDAGHRQPCRAGEQGMSAVSALEPLQLQLLERWSSLCSREHANKFNYLLWAKRGRPRGTRGREQAFWKKIGKRKEAR